MDETIWNYLKYNLSVETALEFYRQYKGTTRKAYKDMISALEHDEIWEFWFSRDLPELWEKGQVKLTWYIPTSVWSENDWKVYYLWHRLAWNAYKATGYFSHYNVRTYLKTKFKSLSAENLDLYVEALRPFFDFYMGKTRYMKDVDLLVYVMLNDVPRAIEIKKSGPVLLGQCVTCGTLEFVRE